MKFPLARNQLLCLLLPFLLAAAVEATKKDDEESECGCDLLPRPDKSEKAQTARWMVHSLSWGTLSSISTRNIIDGDKAVPVPFGNTYSFVDGPCGKSSGVPYFYGTYLDQSFTDILENPMVSLSLTEASLSSVCANRNGLSACQLGTKYGDPESPVCARLTLTGTLEVLEETSDEYQYAQDAIFARHTTMEYWPSDHNWVIGKINIQDVWLIDWFGGAAVFGPDEYFSANLYDDEGTDE